MSKRDERQERLLRFIRRAERAAVYRGGHGKRVRRKRTDDTGRPFFVGSVRANQAHAQAITLCTGKTET